MKWEPARPTREHRFALPLAAPAPGAGRLPTIGPSQPAAGWTARR